MLSQQTGHKALPPLLPVPGVETEGFTESYPSMAVSWDCFGIAINSQG